jgi:hypothetical protein
VAAATSVDGDRVRTVAIDDLRESLGDLVEGLDRRYLRPAVALPLFGTKKSVGMMDTLDLGTSLLTGISLRHFVLAISADRDDTTSRGFRARLDIDLEPAEHMTEATERLPCLDHLGVSLAWKTERTERSQRSVWLETA